MASPALSTIRRIQYVTAGMPVAFHRTPVLELSVKIPLTSIGCSRLCRVSVEVGTWSHLFGRPQDYNIEPEDERYKIRNGTHVQSKAIKSSVIASISSKMTLVVYRPPLFARRQLHGQLHKLIRLWLTTRIPHSSQSVAF